MPGPAPALRYRQSTGELTLGGKLLARGYAGHGAGKNKPAMQHVRATGPLPRGLWRLASVADSPNTGPFTITLVPQLGTETFGRSAFRIHGDSKAAPGTASHGCIVVSRAVRETVWASGVRLLTVVE